MKRPTNMVLVDGSIIETDEDGRQTVTPPVIAVAPQMDWRDDREPVVAEGRSTSRQAGG